ncbi:cysteine-rich CWC family protein [Piscinibacter sp.]|uniref:cysteine-rich CWC family protein n=1 Tax=Piscinibacter sp. TaxID=1903157 RepID=UPI002D17141C|nr:cysteine-rich CWC family protein [Albitalea sp.]HUG23451.1 cysteine-rich CWC family protein [Albitalea sp.]
MRWARCRRMCYANSTGICSVLEGENKLAPAICPRCREAFRCGARDAAPCWCTRPRLDAATLAMLNQRYRGCLCTACLEWLAREDRCTSHSRSG